ncbi:MAG: CoA-binding protein [Candidatus Micrarchaeia archaeon]
MNWEDIHTIAFVGASNNIDRDSYKVMMYFREKGFEAIPVNPNHTSIDGIRCYPSLLDIPPELARRIDMIDIFRKSESVVPIVKDAIELKKRYNNLKIVWMQVGVVNDEAVRLASEAGLEVYQNACAMLTHRLSAKVP